MIDKVRPAGWLRLELSIMPVIEPLNGGWASKVLLYRERIYCSSCTRQFRSFLRFVEGDTHLSEYDNRGTEKV